MSDSKDNIKVDNKKTDPKVNGQLESLNDVKHSTDSKASLKEHGNKNYFNAWTFIGLAIICTIVTWLMMREANNQLALTHSTIIEHQKKSIASTDSILNLYRYLITDSLKYSKEEYLEQLNNRLLTTCQLNSENQDNERIGNLLESELSKIQNEYEVLNLWCALLTVVFLIFSFFSIFKANEMANQSEDALKNMRQIEREIQRKYDFLVIKIQKGQEKIGELTQLISTLESSQENLSLKFKTLKDTEIPAIETQISNIVNAHSTKIHELVKNSTDEFKKNTDEKKSEYSLYVEKAIKNLKPQIENVVDKYLSYKEDSSLAIIENLRKSVVKLEADVSEITKGEIDKDSIESEDVEEQLLDIEDELGMTDSDEEGSDDIN